MVTFIPESGDPSNLDENLGEVLLQKRLFISDAMFTWWKAGQCLTPGLVESHRWESLFKDIQIQGDRQINHLKAIWALFYVEQDSILQFLDAKEVTMSLFEALKNRLGFFSDQNLKSKWNHRFLKSVKIE